MLLFKTLIPKIIILTYPNHELISGVQNYGRLQSLMVSLKINVAFILLPAKTSKTVRVHYTSKCGRVDAHYTS